MSAWPAALRDLRLACVAVPARPPNRRRAAVTVGVTVRHIEVADGLTPMVVPLPVVAEKTVRLAREIATCASILSSGFLNSSFLNFSLLQLFRPSRYFDFIFLRDRIVLRRLVRLSALVRRIANYAARPACHASPRGNINASSVVGGGRL